MGVWGSITRVESRARSPLLLTSAAMLAVGLGTLAVTRTDFVLPPQTPPTVVYEREHLFLYRDQVYPDWATAKQASRMHWLGYQRARDLDADIHDAVVDVGYIKTDEDSSGPFTACMGREELWARVTDNPPRNWTPVASLLPDDQQAKLRAVALKKLGTDPRISGLKLGVSASAPLRTWVNGRGTAAAIGGMFSWLSGPTLVWLGWAEIAARARPRRIKAGLCPKCTYSLAGSDFERCPECGQALSLHERSVLAAMTLPHRRIPALPA